MEDKDLKALIKDYYKERDRVLKKYSGGESKMKKWWKAAGIRAIKTICQTAVATIGTAAVMEEVNWVMVLSASVLAGILSLLTSIAGLPELKED